MYYLLMANTTYYFVISIIVRVYKYLQDMFDIYVGAEDNDKKIALGRIIRSISWVDWYILFRDLLIKHKKPKVRAEIKEKRVLIYYHSYITNAYLWWANLRFALNKLHSIYFKFRT